MATKFTDLYIRNLQPQPKRYLAREGEGFAVEVQPSGLKSWKFIYDFVGQRRKLTLGNYPDMGLQEARKAFQEARRLLAQGIDPAEQKQRNREAQKAERLEPTVTDLAAEFVEKYSKPKKRTWEEDERILHKDVIPAWGKRKAKDITRRDVALLVDKVAKRGGIMGNRTLACVRRMFNFAVERGTLEASPVVHVKAPAKETRRDRVLTPAEIRLFWEAQETAPVSHYLRLALRLLLATGQRKGEVLTAQWVDVDLASGWWIIPASRVKNGHLHRVPLNSTATAILTELQSLNLPGPWLFPSPRGNGENPVTDTSLDHALRRCEFDGVEPFTPHDLRRTVGTALGELGFNRLVQDKVLNHVDRTVGGIYDRHTYDREKRQALDAWDRRLQEILTGQAPGNVVPFVKSA